MRALSCLLLFVAIGCGGPGAREGAEDPDLALLEALPYADWDEEVDETTSGIVHHDPDRAWEGINLYTNRDDEAYLMGMDGRILHTWYLPDVEEPCGNFELVGNGEIIAWCKQTQLVRVDRDSNLIWKIEIPVHHDFDLTADGGLVLLVKERIRRYEGRRVQFGGIAFLGPDGRRRHHDWLAFEHLDELKPFHRESSLDTPRSEVEESQDAEGGKREGGKNGGDGVFDYYHWNTIELLPDTPLGRRDERFRAGNLLLCPRNVNTILVLDQDTLQPVWSWNDERLSLPHMPTMLPDGRILLFDNGVKHRRSRILEIEALTGEVVWRYPETDTRAFFSLSRGSSQRLPNGNTLICESDRGHAFEITPEGERVWAFRNPVRKRGRRRAIYRMMRLSREEVTRRMRVDGRSASGAR